MALDRLSKWCLRKSPEFGPLLYFGILGGALFAGAALLVVAVAGCRAAGCT